MPHVEKPLAFRTAENPAVRSAVWRSDARLGRFAVRNGSAFPHTLLPIRQGYALVGV